MRRFAQHASFFIACAAYSALSLAQEVQRPIWWLNDTWTYRRTEYPAVWDGGGRLPSGRKFTIVGVRGGFSQDRQECTVWYSPDAKAVVKHEWRGFYRTYKAEGEVIELESVSVR
jgi:hypothetical protein